MKKIKISMIKRLLRINSKLLLVKLLAVQFWTSLSTLSYYFTLREFLEHSSIGERKEKEGQGRK